VKALSKKYPNISLKVKHVQHTTPELPKNDTTPKQGKNEPTKSAKVKGNDIKLKSLLPKDLEKTIKNPETGRMIKMKSALGYDEKSKVFQAAQRTLKK
jgi:hypothetical protein